MKTQITTKKGTKVNFEVEEINKVTMIVGDQVFKKEDIGYTGEELFDNTFRNSDHKSTRIQFKLDKENAKKLLAFIEKIEAKKRQKEIDEYMHLQEQLPEIDFPEGGNNDEKAQELLEQANSKKYYKGPETDGLNLAVTSQANKLRSEAQKYCSHETEVSYLRTHTADARKKIERTVECKKCGLTHKHSASEEVSETARWR